MIEFKTKSGRKALAKKVIVETRIIMGLEGHPNGLISDENKSLECVDTLTGRKFFAPVWAITEEEEESLPLEEKEITIYHENW